MPYIIVLFFVNTILDQCVECKESFIHFFLVKKNSNNSNSYQTYFKKEIHP